ncbi:MAG: hypothetical protein LBF68_00430 [Christensenellaceae bacterium]|jgi:hypothetical protein|nr:hypothetical protein [Christensenellaceae bacterium]
MNLDDFTVNNDPEPTLTSDNGDLTYGRLKKLLAKSAPRILLFCVTVAILMCLVTAIILFSTTSNKQYVTTEITFGYSQSQQGLDPYGANTLDLSQLKSVTVITNAVNALNANLDVKDRMDSDKLQTLIESVEIEQIIKSTGDTTSDYPAYKITLTNLKKLGLSINNASSLLNNIVNEYFSYFVRLYSDIQYVSSEKALSTQELTDEDIDYVDIVNSYTQVIDTIHNQIKALKLIAPTTFKSTKTKMSFDDLVVSLDNISESIEKNLNNILANCVSKDIDLLLGRYALQIDEYKIKYNALSDTLENGGKIAELRALLESLNIDNLLVLGDSKLDLGTGTNQSTAINHVATLLTEAINEQTSLKLSISFLDYQLATFTANKELASSDSHGATTQKLNVLHTSIVNHVNLINSTIEDFFSNYYFRDVVYISRAMQYSSGQTSTLILMIIITLAAMFLATCCAVIITNHYIKKLGIPLN